MKKLFNHAKKSVQDWEDYDSAEYDWDNPDETETGENDGGCREEEFSGDYIEEDGEYYDAEEVSGEDAEGNGEYYADEAGEDYVEASDEYYEPDEVSSGYYEADETGENFAEEPEDYYGADEAVNYSESGEFAGEYAEEIEEYGESEELAIEYAEEIENYSEYEELAVEYAEEIEDYGETGELAEEYAEEIENYSETGELVVEYAEEIEEYSESGELAEEYAEEAAEYYESEDSSDEYYGQEESSDGYYEPEEGYYEAEDSGYEEDDYGPEPARGGNRKAKKQAGQGFWAYIGNRLRNMDVMDYVMLAAGACVLALVLIVSGVLVKNRVVEAQVADFANVGTELDGITLIGEKGLSAVANAEMAKIAAASVVIIDDPLDEPAGQDEDKKGYDEIGYQRQVSVEPGFTSIQKDLKIKFINKNTNKLVANVPFSVTVTDPNGKTYIWSDDDMDGIIYKKDITPGNYKVAMDALTDSKYSGYTVSSSAKTVEVKEEIVYAKVDVVSEVKTEAEINVAKEDTKINETVVESILEDTVPWVESKVIGAVYNEVTKSSIPDPVSLALGNGFMRVGQIGKAAIVLTTESMLPPATTDEPTAPPETTEEPTAAPTEEPTAPPAATEEPTAAPTEEPTASPVATEGPTAVPTATPTVTPALVKGTVSVDKTALTGAVNAVFTAKASANGFAEGVPLVYNIQSGNPSVASATIDNSGNISITGVAEGKTVITVTANYQNGAEETAATASIDVTIVNMVMTLDKTAATVYMQVPVTVNASIANAAAQDLAVTAESSDTNIATVSVNGKSVVISGVAEGSAVITVKYMENGVTVSAACAVTVKKHPKDDNVTLLKAGDGQQLYVLENGAYREATHADYYTAEKFFVKGGAKYTGWQTIDGKVYYFTADSKIVTGEQVIQGAKYNFASDGSLVTGDGVLGIDVSKWNGTIDWNAVKNSGISYVIIRCGYRGSSEGKLIEDPKFESNIKGATAAGLKVGVYFFTQAVDEIEAVEEASMVLELIKNYKISYPVFIDVEASGGRADKIDSATRTAVCRAFCQTIQNEGYTAGVYSGKLWLEGKLDAASLNMYKIWLAQYAAAPTYTGRYDLWQYKSNGSVSGISGNVDLNISYLGY